MENKRPRIWIVVTLGVILIAAIIGFFVTNAPNPEKAVDTYASAVLGKSNAKTLDSTFRLKRVPVASEYKSMLENGIASSLSSTFDTSKEEVQQHHGQQVDAIAQAMINKLKSKDIKYTVTDVKATKTGYTANVRVNGLSATTITENMRTQLAENVLDNLDALSNKDKLIDLALNSMPKAIAKSQPTTETKAIKVELMRKWYQNKWTLVDAKPTTEKLLKAAFAEE